MRTLSVPLLLFAAAGCRSVYEDAKKPIPAPELENARIASAQFADVPAPEGFRLRTSKLESYSYECGSFRQGRLLYDGGTPVARVASYLRERLPHHGWTVEGESAAGTGRSLVCRKGRTRLQCAITRSGTFGGSRTLVSYEVEPAAVPTN